MATGSQIGLQTALMGDTKGRREGWRVSTIVIDATSTDVPERERTR